MEKITATETTWFTEAYDCITPPLRWSTLVEQVLYHERSQSGQDILIFKNHGFGNVLAINGKIQMSELDECNYHEIFAHIPLNCHLYPKHILIIGGGDGGLVREVVKHPSVETVTVVDIDPIVVELSKRYFPKVSCKLSDPRVQLHIGDGVEFVKNCENAYDVILFEITPDESAELYGKEFWQKVKRALRPHGIVVCLGEDVFYSLDDVKKSIETCRDVFPSIAFAYAFVPCFLGGQGYLFYSCEQHFNFTEPAREFSREDLSKLGLQYYNSELHRAAFAVPEYAKKVLQSAMAIQNGPENAVD